MEADETFIPVEISLFGADGIATQAYGLTWAVSEFLLRHNCSSLHNLDNFPFRGILKVSKVWVNK